MSKDAWNRFSDEGYKHYQVIRAGYKYNMMDIQAAMGIHQLKRVDKYWERRKNIWDKYNEAFKGLPCIIPAEPEPDTRHAYHLYTPLIDIDKLGKSRDLDFKCPFYRKYRHGCSLSAYPFASLLSRDLRMERRGFSKC
jgi:dTDP-4-amino-4,6-dideoxygalactose transaminase